VFRRDEGKAYVALDYGHSGGGHGHPDRLNVLLADGETRWLDDYGTGSYVDPSLHWYRSTLAHNAPLVGAKSQLRADGTLVAYDERGAAGWIVATADGIAPDVRIRRTLVVMSHRSTPSSGPPATDRLRPAVRGSRGRSGSTRSGRRASSGSDGTETVSLRARHRRAKCRATRSCVQRRGTVADAV
jgi:hypothetical protein